jgi:hypothetical protein
LISGFLAFARGFLMQSSCCSWGIWMKFELLWLQSLGMWCLRV